MKGEHRIRMWLPRANRMLASIHRGAAEVFFIVMGEPVKVTVSPFDAVHDIAEYARWKTRNLARRDWEVRTARGELVDADALCCEVDRENVYVSPSMGMGASAA